METPIYFSKIEFQEHIGFTRKSCLLLNLVEKELSYQVFELKKQSPAIQESHFIERGEIKYSYDVYFSARIIRNGKNNFQPNLFISELFEEKMIFSYGIKLTDEQMKALLPYCNALEFEPFRNRKMSMNDKGYIGYRDEVRIEFRATTNSYIPLMKLPMKYYYDEQHIWPNEKLYRYLLSTYFDNNKETEKWITPYGGFSLFF